MELKKLGFCRRMYTGIRSTAALFQSYMDPLFEEVGLRPLEGCLLAELGYADGRTIKELSRATSIGETNVAPLWHALEDKGLVTRKRDELDGRSYRLFITESGHAVLERLDALVGLDLANDDEEMASVRARVLDGFAACSELFASSAGSASASASAGRAASEKSGDAM